MPANAALLRPWTPGLLEMTTTISAQLDGRLAWSIRAWRLVPGGDKRTGVCSLRHCRNPLHEIINKQTCAWDENPNLGPLVRNAAIRETTAILGGWTGVEQAVFQVSDHHRLSTCSTPHWKCKCVLCATPTWRFRTLAVSPGGLWASAPTIQASSWACSCRKTLWASTGATTSTAPKPQLKVRVISCSLRPPSICSQENTGGMLQREASEKKKHV